MRRLCPSDHNALTGSLLLVLLLLTLTACGSAGPPTATPTATATAPPFVPLATPVPPTVALAPLPTAALPTPQPTDVWGPWPTPGQTPTWVMPTITPTPAVLQAAEIITPDLVSRLTEGAPLHLPVQSAINTEEALQAVTWAPTGDKLVYVTTAGKLYWAEPDGSHATLLRAYDNFFGPLDQMAPGATLFVRGAALHFTPGLPPVLADAAATADLHDLYWWNLARASGTRSVSYVAGGYVGGDMLVTVDGDGQVVEERNVPYMWRGAIQPGGAWLAYATEQQATDTPFYGSDPQTIYLLNLSSGRRLQLTEPGGGFDADSWSPDGKWFLMTALIGQCPMGVVVSGDGHTWLPISVLCGNSLDDGVWSPDSRYLAFSVETGGCEPESIPPCPLSSDVYIADVRDRVVRKLDLPTSMMSPHWSPDGSILTLLSFDPDGYQQSLTTPAIYHLAVR